MFRKAVVRHTFIDEGNCLDKGQPERRQNRKKQDKLKGEKDMLFVEHQREERIPRTQKKLIQD